MTSSLSLKKECQNCSYSHAKYCPNIDCEYIYLEEDVKEAVKELKLKWKAKTTRMDIMTYGVAYLELVNILDDIFGKELTDG